MAGWISSKLKVAESLLQQIDQQAAESLGKSEGSLSPDAFDGGDGIANKRTSTASSADSVPLKLQLNKKPTAQLSRAHDSNYPERIRQGNAPDSSGKLPAKLPDLVAADEDWTELLGSAPNPTSPASGALARKRNVKRRGIPIASVVEDRRSRGSIGVVGERKYDVSAGDVKFRKPGGLSREELGSSTAARSQEDKEERGSGGASELANLVSRNDVDDDGIGQRSSVDILHVDVGGNEAGVVGGLSTGDTSAGVTHSKGEAEGDSGEIRKPEERYRSSTTVGNSAPHGSSRSSSEDSGRSDSETDSASSSDSETERLRREERRKRRERINAEKATALASEAIKERENIVARLEGEKQSLEKILEEREKQQAQEASELQTSMMETMDAVDLEKQRHNSTRMEALACLAALESTNAELARCLATTQWNLEIEANKVAEIRQQIEAKQLAQEELRLQMSKYHKSTSSLNQIKASSGAEYEEEILEAEHSFVCDKIKHLKEKAKKIEEDIEMTRKEITEPTEVEVELKGRLEQLTDHLIQKQTQVETLSSEKAMMLFRIETVLRFLDDNGLPSQLANLSVDSGMVSIAGPSSRVDIEAGTWEPSNLTKRTPFPKNRSAEQHIGSFLRQLDAIFSAGSLFLRKNPMAKVWSLVYIFCLHLWVIYVISSHSQPSDGVSSALISLENINNTTGP